MQKIKKNRCQATMEYLLFLAVLLLVLLFALGNQEGSLSGGIRSYIDGLGTAIEGIIDEG